MRFTALLLATASAIHLDYFYLEATQPGADEICQNTDHGEVDDMGVGCEHEMVACDGMFDNANFVASDMCCKCGGGHYRGHIGSDDESHDGGDEFPGATLFIDEADGESVDVMLHVDAMHVEEGGLDGGNFCGHPNRSCHEWEDYKTGDLKEDCYEHCDD